MPNARVLWYLFHPRLTESRGNRSLFEAVADLPNVTTVAAYDAYPDFRIDVAAE